MDGGHHLSAGIEGNLANSFELNLFDVLGKTKLFSVVYKSCLGRLTDCGACLGVKLCIGAEGHSVCKKSLVVTVVVNNGHLVLGKSTGLVGADDLGASESFNCGKLTNDCVTLGHIGNADGKNDSNNGCKSLGDSGNCKRNSYHEGVEDRLKADTVTDKLNAEDNHADTDNEVGEDLGKTCELDLKGSLALFCLCKRVCDLTHFGIHTCSNDYCLAASVNDYGAHEYHVFTVTESNVAVLSCGENLFLLVNGNGFTGECRFLYLHRSALDNTSVCGNCVTCFKYDNITNYQVFTGNGDELAITNDLGLCLGHFLKRFDSLFGLAFLENAEYSVNKNNCKDDNNVSRELRQLACLN